MSPPWRRPLVRCDFASVPRYFHCYLAGSRIRRGDRVSIWLPSGNRDEAVFERPDRFDVGRKPNEHLSFGVGQHFCLGAHLARLTLEIVIADLTPRLPSISLAGPIERQRSSFGDGIRSMPIRVLA